MTIDISGTQSDNMTIGNAIANSVDYPTGTAQGNSQNLEKHTLNLGLDPTAICFSQAALLLT